MPAQERRGRNEERRPRSSRKQPAERSQKRPISQSEPRPSNLPLQRPQLVTQQQDLDLLLSLRTRTESQLDQPPKRPIQKRQNHPHDDRRAYRSTSSADSKYANLCDDRISGTHTVTELSDSRPGREVWLRVRRNLPKRRRQGHPHAYPGPECECA